MDPWVFEQHRFHNHGSNYQLTARVLLRISDRGNKFRQRNLSCFVGRRRPVSNYDCARDCVLTFVGTDYPCAGVLHQIAPRLIRGLRWVRSLLGADQYFVRCSTSGLLGGNPVAAFEFSWCAIGSPALKNLSLCLSPGRLNFFWYCFKHFEMSVSGAPLQKSNHTCFFIL